MKIENYGDHTSDLFTKGVFAHLSAKERSILHDQQVSNKYKKGQAIFEKSNHPPGVFCIVSGNVKLTKTSFDGKHSIIKIMSEGDIFGHDSIFSETTSGTDAIALNNAVVYFVDKKYVLEAIRNQGQTAYNFIAKLTKDIIAAESKIVSFNQKNVRERLAELLYDLSLGHGSEEADKIRINIKLTREEMANIIGTANETLIRFMTEFKDNRLIEQDGKTIYITNQSKLKEWAKISEDLF